MNKFKDFIEIDKKFQNSINLQLDIDNLSKLNSYIPTHSSILVLDGFLNNVLSDRDKANILIGPYGNHTFYWFCWLYLMTEKVTELKKQLTK